jgi:hypothetical protein
MPRGRRFFVALTPGLVRVLFERFGRDLSRVPKRTSPMLDFTLNEYPSRGLGKRESEGQNARHRRDLPDTLGWRTPALPRTISADDVQLRRCGCFRVPSDADSG